jgi:hypothetical protein
MAGPPGASFLGSRHDCYEGFVRLAVAGAVHVLVVLTSLALAFLSDVPVMALLWFVAASAAIAIGFVRSKPTVRAVQEAT